MTKNKVLITGASQGIGYVIAKYFAENNFNVFITARNEAKLKELCSSNGNIKGFFACDITDLNSQKILYNKAKETLEGIDILINNAGAYVCAEIEKTKFRKNY